MHKDRLELPTGQRVGAQEIIAGIALLSISSELEIKTSTRLLKLAEQLAQLNVNKESPIKGLLCYRFMCFFKKCNSTVFDVKSERS